MRNGSQELVRSTRHLSAADQAAVEEMVAVAARVDGVRALDERATLLLRNTDGTALHLLTGDPAESGTPVTGYARLDGPASSAGGDGATGSLDADGEADQLDADQLDADQLDAGPLDAGPLDAGPLDSDVVVHPEHRRLGLGRLLVERLVAEAAGRPVQVWAHGPHPAAARLAEATGFAVVRKLLWMRRPLVGPDADPLPDLPTPDGVTIRPFQPGRDDAAWLEVNAAAFAHHPEQGHWTQADLDARISAPWFDPTGFFLAERAGTLLGFHWTKVHHGATRGDEPEPVGEIYVLGVSPAAQGTGLAKKLAVDGLAYLRDRGVRTVMLYVEADNTAAVRLYERFGFATAAADVMYRRPGTVR